MFDSVFEKLQQDFKAQFGQAGKDASEEFASAFSDLPQKMQKIFGKDLLNNFYRSSKNLSALFFKNMEYMKSGLRLLKDQEDGLLNLTKKIQAEMQKIDAAKLAEDALHAQAYKGLSATGASIDDLLALDDLHAEKMEQMNAAQDQLNKMMGAAANILNANLVKQQMILQVLKQQQFVQHANSRLNQAFGINATNIGNFFGRFNSFPKILLEIAIGVGELFKLMVEGYRQLRKGGMDGAQAISTLFSRVIADQWKGAKQGVLASTKDFAQNYAAMANSIGNIDVPDQAVVDATRLTTQFGLSAEEASGLTGEMLRMSKWSAETVAHSQKMARAMADANKIGIGTMMKDVAKNAELLGNYAGRGFDAFYKSVIAARQYGVELKTISGFADNLVNDFESSIVMQAKLQTINPALDLSQVMYASQFGSDEQVADALHNALAGAGYQNLGTLPRSIRNMITSTLGMSANDLTNLMTGKKEGGPVKEGDEHFSDAQRAFTTSIADFVTGNKILVNALAALTGAVVANTLAHGASGWLGKLFGSGGALGTLMGGGRGLVGSLFGGGSGLSRVLGAVNATGNLLKGAGALGGGLAIGGGALDIGKSLFDDQKGSTLSALNRHKFTGLGALIGSFVPGLGTLVGAGAGGLTDWLVNSYSDHHAKMEAQRKNAPSSIPDATVRSAVEATAAAQTAKLASASVKQDDSNPNAKVEDLLKQLIKAVKDGHVIEMDGKEVGKAIVLAHRGA